MQRSLFVLAPSSVYAKFHKRDRMRHRVLTMGIFLSIKIAIISKYGNQRCVDQNCDKTMVDEGLLW
jgi:hypothetical protein